MQKRTFPPTITEALEDPNLPRAFVFPIADGLRIFVDGDHGHDTAATAWRAALGLTPCGMAGRRLGLGATVYRYEITDGEVDGKPVELWVTSRLADDGTIARHLIADELADTLHACETIRDDDARHARAIDDAAALAAVIAPGNEAVAAAVHDQFAELATSWLTHATPERIAQAIDDITDEILAALTTAAVAA